VKSPSELLAASNLNFIGSYRKLAEHAAGGKVHEVGPVFAFVTGVPIPLFNGCLVLEPAAAVNLEAALEWLGAQHLPYTVWIDENAAPGLSEAVFACGLERDEWSLPAMVLCSPPEQPPEPAGVTITPVTRAGFGTWLGVLVEDGLPPELADRLFPPSFAVDPDVRLFTAYLDGNPAGTSVAIRTGEVSGVYAVITRQAARRRGVGAAASWAAVDAGRTWGCDVIALQASEMGFSTYTRMGFQTVVRYATFNQPGDAS
jgi:GNAT superfamily N-acetyltransferase